METLSCRICGTAPQPLGMLLRCQECRAFSCFGCTKRVQEVGAIRLGCGVCGSPHLVDVMANTWQDHPELQRPVPWVTAIKGGRNIVFEAVVDQQQWAIRLNNFPEEPAFSLIIEGREVIHFDDWPSFWGTRPEFPKGGGQE